MSEGVRIMLKEDIKKFAIQQGFEDAKEIGKYKNFTVYQPLFNDGKPRMIGYPQYIFVDGEEIKLHVDVGFEVSQVFFSE